MSRVNLDITVTETLYMGFTDGAYLKLKLVSFLHQISFFPCNFLYFPFIDLFKKDWNIYCNMKNNIYSLCSSLINTTTEPQILYFTNVL